MKLCRFSEPDYLNVVDDLVNRANLDLYTQDETVRKILNDVLLLSNKSNCSKDIFYCLPYKIFRRILIPSYSIKLQSLWTLNLKYDMRI